MKGLTAILPTLVNLLINSLGSFLAFLLGFSVRVSGTAGSIGADKEGAPFTSAVSPSINCGCFFAIIL